MLIEEVFHMANVGKKEKSEQLYKAILELEDSRTLQCFDVGLLGYNDKNAANWTLKFEILDVYPGEKYEDTAISELYFDGVDVH